MEAAPATLRAFIRREGVAEAAGRCAGGGGGSFRPALRDGSCEAVLQRGRAVRGTLRCTAQCLALHSSMHCTAQCTAQCTALHSSVPGTAQLNALHCTAQCTALHSTAQLSARPAWCSAFIACPRGAGSEGRLRVSLRVCSAHRVCLLLPEKLPDWGSCNGRGCSAVAEQQRCRCADGSERGPRRAARSLCG